MTQRELTPADYIAMLRRRWVLIAIFCSRRPAAGLRYFEILPPAVHLGNGGSGAAADGLDQVRRALGDARCE